MTIDDIRARLVPEGECLVWPKVSLTKAGYGFVRLGKVQKLVHVALWEARNGPVPTGRKLRHLCHGDDSGCSDGPTCPHRRCCNLDHLAYETDAGLADIAEADAEAALDALRRFYARPNLQTRFRRYA